MKNPIVICKCGGKFRKHDWSGKKTYTQCFSCYKKNFELQTKKYIK